MLCKEECPKVFKLLFRVMRSLENIVGAFLCSYHQFTNCPAMTASCSFLSLLLHTIMVEINPYHCQTVMYIACLMRELTPISIPVIGPLVSLAKNNSLDSNKLSEHAMGNSIYFSNLCADYLKWDVNCDQKDYTILYVVIHLAILYINPYDHP